MAALKPKKLISQLIRRGKDLWQERQRLIIILGVLALLAAIVSPVFSPDGFGIGSDESKTETVERDAQGQTTKTVTTTKKESGKTVWDWLSLLGVPLTLAGLGYWLQTIQQKNQAEENKRQQKNQAEENKRQQERQSNETKEESLQVYFDRLSVLLVDKNLLAIAAKKNAGTAAPDEEDLLASALDVIRARTLSILRRFGDDRERKTSVIRFLIEADFISKLKLNLSRADLSRADLFGADLSGVNLHTANLSHANLNGANLNGVDLRLASLFSASLISANLIESDLSGANLIYANLSRPNDPSRADLADLSGAKLASADLRWADLSGTKNLTEEQLTHAMIYGTILPPGINLDPDRDWESMIDWQ